MTAAHYAKAIYEVKKPDIKKIRAALERRKHLKLIPSIVREYQKLALADARMVAHKKITPKKERTRILLELYRTLAHG